MSERSRVLPGPTWSDRRNPVFWTARSLVLLGHRLLVRPHVEMDPAVLRHRAEPGAVFLYCGLHRSLWETSGVMAPMYLAGLPLPFVGMGDNLVKGRVFRSLSRSIGTFLVERPASRRDMLQSALRLRADVQALLANGVDVLLFPEGTRTNVPSHGHYGEFFPAAFDAALDYARHRDEILRANEYLTPRELFVVPLNVDYSLVREAPELAGAQTRTPRTLHVLDSFSMLRGIGDTYLSYGAPIRVAEHVDLDRKAFAALARARCLDLVKILPINVAAVAVLARRPGDRAGLGAAVAETVERLAPFTDRFRGFSPGVAPEEILARASNRQIDFRRPDAADPDLCRLYAGYVAHYLERG